MIADSEARIPGDVSGEIQRLNEVKDAQGGVKPLHVTVSAVNNSLEVRNSS
jgi:hypothetical protein